MRTILLFILASFSFICSNAQPFTFTSTDFTGWPPINWTSASTWTISGGSPGYDYPQTSNDIVIINGLVLLDESNLTVASITINNDALSQFGSLDIQSNTITTTGDVKVLGFAAGFGSLDVNSGTINTGGSFIFNKGSIAFTGCTLNVGDYYSHIEGTMTTSATVNINISTGGTRNDDTNPSIFFGFNAIVTLNTSNVVIDLQNLNTGTAPEIFANNFTVNGAGGTITSIINNNSNISDDICYITSDAAFKTLDLNLNNDVATGNEIVCETVNAGVVFTIADLILSNGLMYTVPITHLKIENSLNVNIDGELTVNGNFTSIATGDLIVDGGLNSTGSLSILSNITGEGIVQGATYTLGPANEYFVYGVQPADSEKAAGGTWVGAVDTDWFNSNNWGRGGIPGSNTAVIIYLDYVTDNVTFPTVNNIIQTATARSIELKGNGANLSIDNNSQMNVQRPGSSPNHGFFIIGKFSDCTVTGGNLTVEKDLNIEADATLTISSGGTVNVSSDVVVKTTGSLTVTGTNSSLTIGP